ncbi:Orange carotenoid protein [Scytonema hofmannii PCC 7110]|uniref:Orange carotenoid protein n=1 Tax=Scytonema hofmannii PCC 7110 TaxID=128403 RepID=A0A139WVH8_9CYAN|nr:orange carotenoid protein N-terminal domain-containing protein [Scytonema hofmannii]KYC36403.1 Orange carotenoid protein [Scytonema hofmannii PCC 7110]
MTFTADAKTKQLVEQFRSFDADTQLALLWFGYLDIKDKLTPANQTSAQDTAAAFYDTICALPKEQQLQAQRDIVTGANSDISRAYKALSSSAKLDLWLRLGRAMEKGTVIQVPSDYKLPSNTQDFTNNIQGLDFEQRIDFTRSAVFEFGAKQ